MNDSIMTRVVLGDLRQVGRGGRAASPHTASPGASVRTPTAIAANCDAVKRASQTTALSMKP